jgi:hypothetical protein
MAIIGLLGTEIKRREVPQGVFEGLFHVSIQLKRQQKPERKDVHLG